jgi:hypothetical protein
MTPPLTTAAPASGPASAVELLVDADDTGSAWPSWAPATTSARAWRCVIPPRGAAAGTRPRQPAQLGAAATSGQPIRPSHVDHPDHWAVIGGAHGQPRVRHPPRLALLRATTPFSEHTAPASPTGPRWETAYRTGQLPDHTAPLYADPERVGRWLWQLLGYAWLDTGDRYRIRDVGLYLARYGGRARGRWTGSRGPAHQRPRSPASWPVRDTGVASPRDRSEPAGRSRPPRRAGRAQASGAPPSGPPGRSAR